MVLIIGGAWWLKNSSVATTPFIANEGIEFSGITQLSLGKGNWKTEHGSTIFNYGYQWQDNGLFLQFGFDASVCENIKKIEVNKDGNFKESPAIIIDVIETKNQELSGNYCNGIENYIFEGLIKDIFKANFLLVIDDMTYGDIENNTDRRIDNRLNYYRKISGTPQDLVLP